MILTLLIIIYLT